MVTFYLSRNTTGRGGGYALTTFLPKAPPPAPGANVDTWWYWGAETDIHLPLGAEDARKIEAKIGRQLEMGEAVNLRTGESVRIEDAPRLESV